MSKIDTLADVASLQSETTALQVMAENNQKIEDAFENTLSRDGSTPNAMAANLDMNNNRLINVGEPVASADAATKGYVSTLLAGIDLDVLSDLGDLSEVIDEVFEARDEAAASAAEAASYVGAATSAPKWTTGRTITLTGDVTGVSPTWDGSTNVSITTNIAPGSVSGSDLAAGAAITNLGFTPANAAGTIFTGEVRINYTPFVSLTADAVGFRGIPVISADNDVEFNLDSGGKMWRHTSGASHTWSIGPLSSTPYPSGHAIMLRNVGTGVVNVIRGSGVALYKDGSGVNANVQLAQWGKALLVHEGGNVWSIGGTGIS